MKIMPSKDCPFFITHSYETQFRLWLIEGTHVKSRPYPLMS